MIGWIKTVPTAKLLNNVLKKVFPIKIEEATKNLIRIVSSLMLIGKNRKLITNKYKIFVSK